MPDDLPQLPLVDVRDGGPVRFALEGRDRALLLRDECLAWLPGGAARLMPVLDGVTRRWLERAKTPYLPEIKAIAGALNFPGIWFLNGSYQWCCTTLAREQDRRPWLARTLDWPYPGLGRHLGIAAMRGPAGDYFNATWPGYVGTLTAMAPGRFAAVINQAPLRRRTRHPWLRPLDLATEVVTTLLSVRDIPPDQLLRQVFETCRTFDEAVAILEATPVARPVIYTIVGCRQGESLVIERTERGAASRSQEMAVANDWHQGQPRWEARMRAERFLTASYEDAADNSRRRTGALSAFAGQFGDETTEAFAWLVPPVLNPYTRLAVEMCPAQGTMRLAGYDTVAGADLPQRVTRTRTVAAIAA